MRLTVVGKGQRSSIEVPISRMVREIASNHRFDCPVEAFGLPIGLGMIGCRERVVHVENLAYTLKELRSETAAIVGDEVFRRAIIEDPFVNETLRDFRG